MFQNMNQVSEHNKSCRPVMKHPTKFVISANLQVNKLKSDKVKWIGFPVKMSSTAYNYPRRLQKKKKKFDRDIGMNEHG